MMNEMSNEKAKEIIIQERDSLKANPRVKVENCLYEAFDVAIKALEFMAECEKRCEESFTRRYAVMLNPSNGKWLDYNMNGADIRGEQNDE